ncbi:hypothetical protein PYW07_007187 [Mythimna separata]|uniref:Patj n=1 Tax=Mythimna separata TaxID=271217 RepID=A0AAD8DZT0_MYTSE|nr:hypothetical protein PYW07_007187 [Mythimna separata]
MHLGVNISNALQQLESVKAAVDQSDDPKLKAATNDDLNMLINLLESPILKSIATLHDSVGMLATQVAHHPSIIPGDFDITPAGDLALQARNLYGSNEGEEEQRVPQVSPPHSLEFGSGSDNERILGLDSGSVDSNMSPKQNRGLLDLSRADETLGSLSHSIVGSDWAQVEIINLVNDGTGLGFGIIGARSSGVIVKTILAGGVADRDGRLKSGDHILQIGDAHLMEMGSEQVAGVLRASGSRVRLVVARAADPAAQPPHPAPLVPASRRTPRRSCLPGQYRYPQAHLMEMGSEQVAGVLRASGSRVRLVVARAADPAAQPPHPAPLVPASRRTPRRSCLPGQYRYPQAHLMEMGSEQVAGVLRASGSRVRLVVARAADPAAQPPHPAPLVPASRRTPRRSCLPGQYRYPQAHLMEMGSEQVAGVLRASGSRVRLVVARAADPAAQPPHPAPLVPASRRTPRRSCLPGQYRYPQAHLMEMGSEQVAGVLRASGSRVRLVVARAADPAAQPPHPAPLVPASRRTPRRSCLPGQYRYPQAHLMEMGSEQVAGVLRASGSRVRLVVARAADPAAQPPHPAPLVPASRRTPRRSCLPGQYRYPQAHLMEMGSEQVAGVLRASGSRVRLVVARAADPAAQPPHPAPLVPASRRTPRRSCLPGQYRYPQAHLMEMGSEQVAGVLRASGSRVRLVVARAADPAAQPPHPAPLVPARLLSDPEALDRYLLDAGFEQVFHTQPTPVPHPNASRFVFDRSITPPPDADAESPEVDRFTVQLKKDENGLGITIAGYVCEKEELSGIFVKSVTPGSAAALSGKVRVNDRIVAVDGVSLAGKSNQRAVDALKQSGNIVTLELERYLRGPKFEQLQQAIAAGETSAAAPVHNPFLHMHRPDRPERADLVPDIPMTQLHNESVSLPCTLVRRLTQPVPAQTPP